MIPEILEKMIQHYHVLHDSGTGYAVDDEFGFNIGGIFFKCVVTSVEQDGSVMTFTMDLDDTNTGPFINNTEKRVSLSNFNDRITIFHTETLKGAGIGVQIKFTVSKVRWNTYYIEKNQYDIGRRPYPYDLPYWPPYGYNLPKHPYVLSYHQKENAIYAIPMKSEPTFHDVWDIDNQVQLTSCLDVFDPTYDDINTKDNRTTDACFMDYLLNHNQITKSDLFMYASDRINSITLNAYDVPYTDDFTPSKLHAGVLFNQMINDLKLNHMGSFYTLVPKYIDPYVEDTTNAALIEYNYASDIHHMTNLPAYRKLRYDPQTDNASTLLLSIENDMPFMYDTTMRKHRRYYNYK